MLSHILLLAYFRTLTKNERELIAGLLQSSKEFYKQATKGKNEQQLKLDHFFRYTYKHRLNPVLPFASSPPFRRREERQRGKKREHWIGTAVNEYKR